MARIDDQERWSKIQARRYDRLGHGEEISAWFDAPAPQRNPNRQPVPQHLSHLSGKALSKAIKRERSALAREAKKNAERAAVDYADSGWGGF